MSKVKTNPDVFQTLTVVLWYSHFNVTTLTVKTLRRWLTNFNEGHQENGWWFRWRLVSVADSPVTHHLGMWYICGGKLGLFLENGYWVLCWEFSTADWLDEVWTGSDIGPSMKAASLMSNHFHLSFSHSDASVPLGKEWQVCVSVWRQQTTSSDTVTGLFKTWSPNEPSHLLLQSS